MMSYNASIRLRPSSLTLYGHSTSIASGKSCRAVWEKSKLAPARRLEGIYRGKGNYFSTVMALILGNKTTSQLASRRDIQGFSQTHQIDIAWPTRDVIPLVDPYICAEAKLTGAPPYDDNEGRGAMDDWSKQAQRA